MALIKSVQSLVESFWSLCGLCPESLWSLCRVEVFSEFWQSLRGVCVASAVCVEFERHVHRVM